jgi:hypothetical protein
MSSINAFDAVGIAGGSWTLRVPAAAAEHPAMAYVAAGAAAAITPQRKRRTATATEESVNRGTI